VLTGVSIYGDGKGDADGQCWRAMLMGISIYGDGEGDADGQC